MPAPNLSDQEARAAYRRELRGVARGMRLSGLGLAWLSVAIMAARHNGLFDLPVWVEGGVLAAGATLVLIAVTRRTKYHRARMGE